MICPFRHFKKIRALPTAQEGITCLSCAKSTLKTGESSVGATVVLSGGKDGSIKLWDVEAGMFGDSVPRSADLAPLTPNWYSTGVAVEAKCRSSKKQDSRRQNHKLADRWPRARYVCFALCVAHIECTGCTRYVRSVRPRTLTY